MHGCVKAMCPWGWKQGALEEPQRIRKVRVKLLIFDQGDTLTYKYVQGNDIGVMVNVKAGTRVVRGIRHKGLWEGVLVS